MALPATIENLEELPELVREHYARKDGESAWSLTLIKPEDHAGLVSALSNERNLRRDAERQLTDLKVRFEGIDPEEVTKLKDRVKSFEDADLYDKHGIEALVVRRTDEMKKDHERIVEAKNREIGQLKDAVSSTERKWKQDRIRTALLAAASNAGVAKEAMQDAVQRGLSVFTDLDDHGNVIARDGEDVRYGKDGISPLSPDEWILALKPTALHLWPPSAGGGAPGHHSGQGQTRDYAKLPPVERVTAWRQDQAAIKP